MWIEAVENFVCTYAKHCDPPPSELTKLLIFLSRQTLPYVIQRLFKKLQIHPHFVFQNGKTLAQEFVAMYVRKERYSFVYYILMGPYREVVSRRTLEKCIEGLVCEKHWRKALEVFQAAKGSRPLPKSFQESFPRILLCDVRLQQRMKSFGNVYRNRHNPLLTQPTPLTSFILLRSVLVSNCWVRAYEMLSMNMDDLFHHKVVSRDTGIMKELCEKLSGPHGQQWRHIVGSRLTENAWESIHREYPLNPYAMFKASQWKNALSKSSCSVESKNSGRMLDAGIQAAVIAGNWEIAFRYRCISHIAGSFENLPFAVTTPIIAIFGLRWHSNGRKLKERLYNNVFTSLGARTRDRAYFRRISHLEKTENLLDHEEKSLILQT